MDVSASSTHYAGDSDDGGNGENDNMNNAATTPDENDERRPRLGGAGLTKRGAFAVLDGVFQRDNSSDNGDGSGPERVTVPIHRLPATLGRTLDNSADRNFIGLGSHKFLSRQHVKIQYLVPTAGGGCGQMQSKVQKPGDHFYFNLDDPVKFSDIVQAGDDGGDDDDTTKRTIPETGFFAITCLSKNRFTVNGRRLEQGQTCWLEPGAAVRIGAFWLYFLTPVEAAAQTMEVRDDVPPAKKARRISLGGGSKGAAVSTALKPSVAGTGTGAGIDKPAATGGGGGGKKGLTLQAELDQLPTKELLKQMNQGIEDNVWDRRHQLIGSTLSYRAVLSATRSAELQEAAARGKGELSRTEIMDWIADSDRYRGWVEHMLSKMEAKSYQSSITKALIKAGFERTSSHGRYIKWRVPADLFTPPDQPVEGENDKNEGGEGNDDDDGDNDEDGASNNEEEGGDDSSEESGDEENGENDGEEDAKEQHQQYESGVDEEEGGTEDGDVNSLDAAPLDLEGSNEDE